MMAGPEPGTIPVCQRSPAHIKEPHETYRLFPAAGPAPVRLYRAPPVVPFRYDNGPDYVREGLYRIVDDRGRMGYADTSGRVAIAPRFAFAFPFEGGKAKVTDTGQRKEVPGSGGEHWSWESDAWYYIDTTGRKTNESQARDATPRP